MRKITAEIANAFMRGEKKKGANTETDGKSVWLHGNLIAERDGTYVHLTLAGWETVTTRERLNGILDVYKANLGGFYQKNGRQFFRDCEVGPRDWVIVDVITGHFVIDRKSMNRFKKIA